MLNTEAIEKIYILPLLLLLMICLCLFMSDLNVVTFDGMLSVVPLTYTKRHEN